MKISCPNCQKKYTIKTAKLPSGVKSAKCRACGHLIPLKEASAKAPIKLILIRFTCAGCGKKYKISQNKIPPNSVAVKCRACGQKIPILRKTAVKTTQDQVQPLVPEEKSSPTKVDRMSEETPPPVSRPRRKKWLFAAAACVLLVVILGILVNLNIVKMDWLNELIPRNAEKTTDSSQLSDLEPFLVLNLNVPLILDAFENRLDPDKKTTRLQTVVSMMKSMNLSQLELYLFSAPNSQVLPVILAPGSSQQLLENAFSGQESFHQYFRRQSDGSYHLQKEALRAAEKYKLPREPYQVKRIDQGAALVPVSLSSAIKENPQLFAKATVAKFAQTIGIQHNLATIAIGIPESLNPGWENKIQNHPAVQATPQTAKIADIGSAIISQLTGSLKPIDVLALGFSFTGQKGRTLNYAQQFRPGVDGKQFYRQLAAENPAESKLNGIIKSLIELSQDQRYQHRFDFKDNRLALEFSWSENEDEMFLSTLTAATIGQLFAGSVALSPTAGAVETRYAIEPYIVGTVNADQLKAKIPRLIKDSIFPGHYWNMGDKPQMTLDLDTINLPNAVLAELTYEVKSIQSPGGKEVLRVENSNSKPRIQPGSLFPGNISLSIKEGTPPDHLGEATIDFQLSMPVALEVFDFVVGDQPGSSQTAGGIRTTLNRLERDVAQVSSNGGKSLWLIAYDQTGKALASRETMSTASSISTRFEGIISTLKVVVTRKMLNYPFAIKVDLNQGKELALSREPEIPPRMRFNPHPSPTYVNFEPEDLQDLFVEWAEGREGSWNDSLSVQLARGPFSGYAIWEVHFFGSNKPRLFAGSSAQSYKDFSFSLKKGKLKQVHAAFGKVQLYLHTNISRLVFAIKNNRQPLPQVLPSGDKVSIEFNKNEITYSAGNADIIQTVAYDSRGKRLKQDQYTRNMGGKRVIYFWGVPAKFEIDASTKTIEKLIPFKIKQRPVDEKAYQAFTQLIENQRDVVKTIKIIDRARRKDRSYYGDDLAGLYYLHHSKQKTPLKLISQEIAHSDPAGQERFGYTAKPYKGYYFTVLSGVETSGVKKEYNRRSKKSRFSWQKGAITTKSLTRHPDLVAIPADDSQPTFFLQWGQVFMKPLNGERLEYLPDGFYNKGWIEAKYIDS